MQKSVMKRFFSVSAITRKLILSAKRFPASVLLIASLTAFLLGMDDVGAPQKQFIFFSLFGAVLCAAAALLLEDLVCAWKQYAAAAITLLWGAYCYFRLPLDGKIAMVEPLVIGIAAFLSMFFISFLKRDTDDAFWNFAARTIFQFFFAYCFGTVILVGLSAALATIDALFSANMARLFYIYKADIYEAMPIFCYALFAPLYFLANIPDKTAKRDEKISMNKTSKILALYILTPLAAVYAVILYAYLFKIIAVWELPDGGVSLMVSGLMSAGLFIIFLLYPARYSLCRYFGLLMLPLLALMSVGIFRRLGDYGLTVFRGYVLLLNVWFYGICVYIFITNARRVKWIVISFAAIALFFSIGPWSVAGVTKRVLLAELRKYSDIDVMKPENRQKIADKAGYLRVTYGDAGVSGLDARIVSELGIDTKKPNRAEMDNSTYFKSAPVCNEEFGYGPITRVPEFAEFCNDVRDIGGFNTFATITVYPNHNQKGLFLDRDIECALENMRLTIKVIPHKRVFSIPLLETARDVIADARRTRDITADKSTAMRMDTKKASVRGDDCLFLIDEISGWYYETNRDSVSIDKIRGYLFYSR